MEYSERVRDMLEKKSIKIGDRIAVEKDGERFVGMLMPKSQGDTDKLIVKLDNGYNIGIDVDGATITKEKSERVAEKHTHVERYKPDASKPTIAILSTGGTVASRIDYETGAVTPLETPDDIVQAIPELTQIANIKTRRVFQMWSEDMEPAHWIELAEKIDDEITSGVDGIIITHGTDTMHYTSAALGLMVQDSPIPILLVGSQRSSDRGSSDAAMNMICAAQLIAKSDFSGVAICMHGSESDDFCYVHDTFHVKKMHTSRRDAFRSIDVLPYAKVDTSGAIEFLREYKRKDKARKPHVVARFDKRCALVKIYPGFDYSILPSVRGIVLEGTGLGHAPIRATDDATKDHEKLLVALKNLSQGAVIAMTSQCPYGKVNLSVYSTGRMLKDAGVVAARMTPECAFVKMGWSLAHTERIDDAKKLFLTNVAGEILDRVQIEGFE